MLVSERVVDSMTSSDFQGVLSWSVPSIEARQSPDCCDSTVHTFILAVTNWNVCKLM